MTDWYQQALTPPRVLELNVRVGVIPSEDHAQCMVELKDPTTNIQLGAWSRPHSNIHGLELLLKWALEKAVLALDAEVGPFE